MRIPIDIDDTLLAEAMQATGAKTINDVVETGLRHLIHLTNQRCAVEDMIGLGWEGDLNASRGT